MLEEVHAVIRFNTELNSNSHRAAHLPELADAMLREVHGQPVVNQQVFNLGDGRCVARLHKEHFRDIRLEGVSPEAAVGGDHELLPAFGSIISRQHSVYHRSH